MPKNFETIYKNKTCCSSTNRNTDYNSCITSAIDSVTAVHSNNDCHSYDCQGINNNNFYLNANQSFLTAKRNTTTTPSAKQLSKNFTIYENLCDNCGHSINQTNFQSTNDRVCDICVNDYVIIDDNNTNHPLINNIEENIYENVCENCGLIYSGSKCTICSVKQKKNSSIFHGLIDSIKHQRNKFKDNYKPTSKRFSSNGSDRRKKLEIIHNVDNVFQTNCTFDLNEICRMKNELSQNNAYGKLRQSDEYLLTAAAALKKNNEIEKYNFDALKLSVSESNFAHLKNSLSSFPVSHGRCKETSKFLLYNSNNNSNDSIIKTKSSNSINIKNNNYSDLCCSINNINTTTAISQTYASSPLFTDIQLPTLKQQQQQQIHITTPSTLQLLLYENNNSVNCDTTNDIDNDYIDDSINSVTSSSSSYSKIVQQQQLFDVTKNTNPLIELWMTSLKHYTEDYDEVEQHMYYNIKCIPSRSFDDCNSGLNSYNINSQRNSSKRSSSSGSVDCSDCWNLQKQQIIINNHIQRTSSITKHLLDQLINDQPMLSMHKQCGSCDQQNNKSNTNNSCSSDMESIRCAVNFNNDIQLQSKRKAIYLKDEILFEQINDMKMILQQQRSYEDEQQNSPSNSNSMLRPKNKQYESLLLESDEPHEPHDMEMKVLVKPITKYKNLKRIWKCNKKSQPTPTRKWIITMQQIMLSNSLNRALITYDKNLQTFLQYISQSPQYYKLDYANLFDCYSHLLFVNSAFNAKQLSSVERNPQQQLHRQRRKLKETISDFELLPAAALHDNKKMAGAKIDIEDFEFRCTASPTVATKVMQDFEKHEPSSKLVKMLSDFELKIKTKQNQSVVDSESIYQPIWMFQTVGNGNDLIDDDDTRTSNGYYDSNHFYEEVDNNEWELAEEFAYATEISDETTNDFDSNENYCVNVKQCYDPYENVCIFYCNENSKINQIFYDTSKHKINVNATVKKCVQQPIIKSIDRNVDQLISANVADSIQAWQRMLLTSNYMEDEEDVVSSILNLYYFMFILLYLYSTLRVATSDVKKKF